MPAATLPANEVARLTALLECQVLDTEPESAFDDLTQLAARLCDAPIALVSLIDAERQWFKSSCGLNVRETRRDLAFCAHAIHRTEPLIIRDAAADERTQDNALVTGAPGIRFYAGVPLMTQDGFALGTLCVIDLRPRDISPTQLADLTALARQATSQLELRRASRASDHARRDSDRRAHLAQFNAGVARSLAQNVELRVMLQEVTRRIVTDLCAVCARIWTLRPGSDTLELQASSGTNTRVDGTHDRIQVGQTRTGLIAAERRPHLKNAVNRDPKVGESECAQREETSSFAGYPLMIGQQVLGVIELFGRTELDSLVWDKLLVVADIVAATIDRKWAEDALYEAQAKTEAALRESEVLANALEKHSIISVADARGRIVSVNDAFCAISKYPREELLGKDHRIINSGTHPKGFWAQVWRTIAGGTAWRGDVCNRAKDGSLYWVDSIIAPFRDAHGKVEKYVSIRNDITERKLAEEQLRTSAAELGSLTHQLEGQNKRLTELYDTAHQFVDSVSHEFRTPLTVIKEFSSIMADGLAGDLSSEQREYLAIVLNRTDDLTRMVNDMLDVSRLEAGLLGIVRRETAVENLINCVRSTLERRAAIDGVDFRIEEALDLPTIFCDEEKVGRVIINLVVNALKFSREQGTVTLRVLREPGGDAIRFEVQDNGPGIAPENLQAIFERFKQVGGERRASTKGFGLGLNIAKELVHLNLGDITVESELGKGSVFAFTVPLSTPTAIMSRFFGYRDARMCQSASATLIRLRADQEHGADTLDEFLHDQLRCNDLLMRATTQQWLLLADADTRLAQELVCRYSKEYALWRNTHDRVDSPELTIKVLGGFEMTRARHELVERVQAEMCAEELCAVLN